MTLNNIAMRALPSAIASELSATKNRAKIGVVGNRKGGTGKTTVCVLLAEGLAVLGGKKVLLIDTDRQCNLSTAFGLSEQVAGDVPHAFSETGLRPDELLVPPVHPDYEEGDAFAARSSSAEVMREDGKPVLPYPTYLEEDVEYLGSINPLNGRVDLLPGDGQKLWEIHSHADRYTPRDLYVRWATWLVRSNVLNDYDLILFDTPPMDTATHEALYQLADHTIVPVQATNDTLSAATAIAYSCMAAQASDQRPRRITTLVNPPQTRIPKKAMQWLETTIWSNQFLGAMPRGLELPRSTMVSDRRDAPLAPHDPTIFEAETDPVARKQLEQQVVRDIREVSLWHRTKNDHRIKLYDIINHLSLKILDEQLPPDPWPLSAKKPESDTDSPAPAETRQGASAVA